MPRNRKFSYPNNVANLSSKIDSKIIVGRVTDIILNPVHPEFSNYGGFNGIGTIFWEEVNSQGTVYNKAAKPFFPQISACPLVNELVLLFSLPNKNIGSFSGAQSYYYINSLSIWNSPHHNAYPNPTQPNTPASQQKDYSTTDKGSPKRQIDSDGTGINLNSNSPSQKTFEEKPHIHPLYPYVGDILYQGRWGNSLRFGSTAVPFGPDIPDEEKIAINNWSNKDIGSNGDPITILRNGQTPNLRDLKTKRPLAGYINISENIDGDLSSVYMTSTQKINITTNPVEVNGKRYFSYTPSQNKFEKNIPTPPNEYAGSSQVIINSDRLVFNSKTDHIMLSSNKTISFEAIKGFNFDTLGHCVINAGTNIKLGGKEATEPIVLGESLRKQLFDLCTNLKQLVEVLKFQQSWPGGGAVPDNQLSTVASNMETALELIIPQLEKDNNDRCPILSDISKTL